MHHGPRGGMDAPDERYVKILLRVPNVIFNCTISNFCLVLQKNKQTLRMTETNNRVTVTCAADSLLICISNIACTEPPSVEWNFCGKTIIGGGERVQMDVIHEGGKTNYEVILRINKVNNCRSFPSFKRAL